MSRGGRMSRGAPSRDGDGMRNSSPLIAAGAVVASLAFTGAASATTATFSSSDVIAPADRIIGEEPGIDAQHYPSTIHTASLPGNVVDVSVTLRGITSTFPGDLDVVLHAPDGLTSLLTADAGGSVDVNNVDLIFDKTASQELSGSTQLTSGVYKPYAGFGVQEFPAPAPSAPFASSLSEFDGAEPNGDWELYAVDDANQDLTQITHGWLLTITTDGGQPPLQPGPTPADPPPADPATTPVPAPAPVAPAAQPAPVALKLGSLK